MLQSQKQKGYKNSPQSNSRFKLWRKYILGIPLILLVSCTNAKQDTQTNQNPFDSNNTNVVRVLNRVNCKESATYCNQSSINIIWKSCLKDGFVTVIPTTQVLSSRNIRELTENRLPVTITAPKDITDESGVTYESNNEVVTTQEDRIITGYCIGSEYIVK